MVETTETDKQIVIEEEAKKVETSRNVFYVDLYDLDLNGDPAVWKIYFAKWMVIWSVVSQCFLFLQAIEIFQQKNAAGVSLAAFILYQVSNIVWFYYGFYILAAPNVPIIASSVVSFLLVIVILVGIGIYG